MRTPTAMIPPTLLLLAAVACDDRPDVDFGGRDIGPELFSIVSTDGNVRLALTDAYVFVALAEETAEDVRSELGAARARDGAAATAMALVERGVDKALKFRTLFPLDEVEDVRWEDGRMRMIFTDPRRKLDQGVRIGDQGLENAFDEASVDEFREALRVVKQERAVRDG
jgi:hypothetical protein